MAQYKQIGNCNLIGPQLTGPELTEAKQQGIRTAIDFRMRAETVASNANLVRNNGPDYASMPAILLAFSRARQDGWVAERTFQEAESMGFNLHGFPDIAAFVRQAADR